ncbi:MAG TPA: DNA methyltransferase [Candidatus Kapabacteria bacterium]|nr:DNA methyltransferase [Candidatus Kapabacteria bacterium]
MQEIQLLDNNSFLSIPIDESWSFTDKTQKDTTYLTHSYYTYPAKFIPQLASRLMKELSEKGDIIIDPFMGSGTTIVESIVNKRIGIGIDINEIAYLVAKVKTTPITPIILNDEFQRITLDLHNRLNGLYDFYLTKTPDLQRNNRIDYWFLPEQKNILSIIYSRILEIDNYDLRSFFMIAFAQILKSCSVWMQRSIKPTRDKNKKINNPLLLFEIQAKKMIKKNYEFEKILDNEVKENIDNFRKIYCGDARNIPCDDSVASLVITSPPYVTSYEYADLHQLPSYWFGFLDDLKEFRTKFIGSAYKIRKDIDLRSSIAEQIIVKIDNKKKSAEVKYYFEDMLESFLEMKRVLKKGGKACIVIGNTELKGVEILNAQVFLEQFENIGFKTFNVIHREIPSKMLPSTRDISTGKFVKSTNRKLKLAYPTEYILIMEKL